MVAATASDVMFVDTMIRSGRGVGFFPIRPPYVPGSGVGGEVISVGDGVDEGWLGRRVIAHTGSAGGGYAERAAVSLEDTVAVPDGLDPLLAVAIIHDGPTALRVARLVDVQPGEQVLVLGAAGGMGILLVQLLRARGARVIGAARGSAKVDAVGAAGADVVIDYGQPGWTSLVLDATGGSGPAVVLDGVGGQLGLDAYAVIADGGRFSAHGAPGGGFAAIDRGDAGRRKVTVTGLGGPSGPAGRTGRPRPAAPARGRLGADPAARRPDLPAGRGRPRARAHGGQAGRRQDAADLGLIARSYSAGTLAGSAVTPRSRAAAEICRASSTSRELSPPTSCVDSHTTTLGYRRSTSGW